MPDKKGKKEVAYVGKSVGTDLDQRYANAKEMLGKDYKIGNKGGKGESELTINTAYNSMLPEFEVVAPSKMYGSPAMEHVDPPKKQKKQGFKTSKTSLGYPLAQSISLDKKDTVSYEMRPGKTTMENIGTKADGTPNMVPSTTYTKKVISNKDYANRMSGGIGKAKTGQKAREYSKTPVKAMDTVDPTTGQVLPTGMGQGPTNVGNANTAQTLQVQADEAAIKQNRAGTPDRSVSSISQTPMTMQGNFKNNSMAQAARMFGNVPNPVPSPSQFNSGLRKASAEGKLDNNPNFKSKVDAAPIKAKVNPGEGTIQASF